MGWFLQDGDIEVVGGKAKPFCVGHTGGAVGATGVLLIVPQNPQLGEDKVSTLNKKPSLSINYVKRTYTNRIRT